MWYLDAARRSSEKFIVTVVLAVASVVAACAQCAPVRADPSKPPTRYVPLLPESGYISDSTYTNVFFGFSLDLPVAAQGHLVRLPLMPQGQHALLAIAFQNGDRSGSLTIDAVDPREGLEGFSAKQPAQPLYSGSPGAIQPGAPIEPQGQPQVAPQGTLVAPQAQPGTPQFYLPAERLHLSERHKGDTYTALYRTEVRNYRLGILISTNDKEFLQKSKQATSALRFYCTGDNGILATKEGALVEPAGERYEGPTVPTWRADAAIQSNRSLAIPPGEIVEGVYRNAELGLQYALPKGWKVLPTRNSGNPPADVTSLREFQFLHACSRTLLRIQQGTGGDTGGSARQPIIVLRALDPNCLSLRVPTAADDMRTAEEVGVSLEAMSEFGQIASHQLELVSGQLFMVFRGTISAPAEAEQLAQRMSQAIVATNYNNILLVWSFMAPTANELTTLPAGGMRLAESEQIDLAPALTKK